MTKTSFRSIRQLGLLAAFAAIAGFAQAEDWYLNGNQGSDTVLPLTTPSCWSNLTKQVCKVIDANDVFHVEFGYTLTVAANATFEPTLHLGKSDGNKNGVITWRKPTVTFKDLRWHRGEFILNYSNVDAKIQGDVHLDNPTVAHQIHFSQSSTPGNPAAFTFGCKFHATATNQNIYVFHHAKTTADLTKSFQFQISGDNSDYNGYFTVDKYAYAVFSHANATGNPAASRVDAVQLGDHARLSVLKGVTLNSVRGIMITGDDVKITATNFTYGAKDCTSFTLAMPITGTKGFTKTGPGTVTLTGAYSAGPIIVENGTLTLNEAGTYPDGMAITVKAGAKLVQRKYIPNIQVTCEPGGTWQRQLVVPYVAASQTATPIDLTTASADLFPMEIQLSSKISIPCPAIQPFAVAYLPEGPTVADFTDATTRTYELPHTSFKIETDDQNRRVLVLVPKPVVQSSKEFPSSLGGPNNAGNGYWINFEGAPRSGYDFLMTHKMSELGNEPFVGDSITYAKNSDSTPINVRVGGGTAKTKEPNVSYINASVYYTRYFIPNYSGIQQVVNGKLHVIGALGDANPIEFRAKYGEGFNLGGTIEYAFDVDGEAPIKLTCDASGARNAQLTFSGDNSAYKGKITVTDNYATNVLVNPELSGLRLIFNEAKNLGGALDAFAYDALKVDRYARLCPSQDVVLDTVNRGVYVTTGGVDVASGVTLKVLEPLRVNGMLFKLGAGTLALGGTLDFGSNGKTVGSRNELFVREGYVEALADSSVSGFKTVFADGAGIKVAPVAGVTTGFTGDLTAEGRIAVALDVTQPGFEAGSSGQAPICTVADDSGITLETFAVNRAKGYACTVTAAPAGDGMTRYSFEWQPTGFVILMR